MVLRLRVHKVALVLLSFAVGAAIRCLDSLQVAGLLTVGGCVEVRGQLGGVAFSST